MLEAGHSKPVLWDNPEGWDGEGGGGVVWDGGTHVHPWLIYVNVGQKPPQYCKVISLQLKLINFFKKSCSYLGKSTPNRESSECSLFLSQDGQGGSVTTVERGSERGHRKSSRSHSRQVMD